MSYLASSQWGRPLCYGHAAARYCLQRGRRYLVRSCVTALGADFKCISSVRFGRIESNLVQYTRETYAKNDGPEF